MRGGITLLVLLAWPALAAAQQARPSPIAIDTVASIDEAVDTNGNDATGVFLDAVVTVGLGKGFEMVTWPIVQRQQNDWTSDLWIATLRYERAGRVSAMSAPAASASGSTEA